MTITAEERPRMVSKFNCDVCGYGFDHPLAHRHSCITVLKALTQWHVINSISDIPDGEWLAVGRQTRDPFVIQKISNNIFINSKSWIPESDIFAYKAIGEKPTTE